MRFRDVGNWILLPLDRDRLGVGQVILDHTK